MTELLPELEALPVDGVLDAEAVLAAYASYRVECVNSGLLVLVCQDCRRQKDLAEPGTTSLQSRSPRRRPGECSRARGLRHGRP